MGRWGWCGRGRGRQAVEAAVTPVIEQLKRAGFGRAIGKLEQLEKRIPVSGPISLGAAGLMLDQPWQQLFGEDAAAQANIAAAAQVSIAPPEYSLSLGLPLASGEIIASGGSGGLGAASSPAAVTTSSDLTSPASASSDLIVGSGVAAESAARPLAEPAPSTARFGSGAEDEIVSLASGSALVKPLAISQPPGASNAQPSQSTSSDPTTPPAPTTPTPDATPANIEPRNDVQLKSTSLADWAIVEDGGSAGSLGAAAFDEGDIILREGDSFLLAAEQSFVVPANPGQLNFTYDQLSFDTTDPDSINDAFEVALLDSTGQTVVHTFTAGRDAFFNITEEMSPALGIDTQLDNTAVSLDISALAPGSTAKIIFRLVNNDQDENTTVRILGAGAANETPVVTVQPIIGLEGQVASLSASFTDAGDTGAHTAIIDWGDNSTSVGVISGSSDAGMVSGTHVYADNGVYQVKVTVTDSENAIGEGSSTADIANVAPTLEAGFNFTSQMTPTGGLLVSNVTAQFSDPGFSSAIAQTEETFTTTIDWGDGQTQTVNHSVTQGSAGVATSGAFNGSHQYANPGLYEVKVKVADDDGGFDEVILHYGIMRIDVVQTINTKEKGNIPVKILSAPGFNPGRDLDPASLRFGPGGAKENHGEIHGDSMTHYPAPDSAIRPTDTVAFLFARHKDGTFFVGMDTIRLTPSSNPNPVTNLPPAKFFVADPGVDTVFRYNAAGGAVNSFLAEPAANNILGVAANAAGDTLWTIDGTTSLVTVQDPNGKFLGGWNALGVSAPTGITTDGKDIWVVDNGTKHIRRFLGGASLRGGVASPATSFRLHIDNTSASDVVTDGTHLFVSDDRNDEVFVYDLTGGLQGRWSLDTRNADASGITLDPTAASKDLWLLDRIDRQVYRYADATDLRTGSASAASIFNLVAANTNPEAIADPVADPPEIVVATPPSGSTVNAGSKVLISGSALAHLPEPPPQTPPVKFESFVTATTLKLNGVAQANINNGIDPGRVLRLTPALTNQAGSAFSLSTINAATFSTFFKFRITDPGGTLFDGNTDTGADGIVFVVQSVANNVGSLGQGIGYQGINKSVGVEWDTWRNSANNDPNSNHLGINTNGSVFHANQATDTRTFATRFDDGNVWYAWVDYDGTTLEVRTNQTGNRPAVADLSKALNIPAILGQTSAFVGFTSGTGADWGNHDIISWEYRDSFDPIGATNRIVSVTMNGTPADVLDDSGNFFAGVTPAVGNNQYVFVATDLFGQTATTTLALNGVSPARSGVDFTVVTDVPSFEAVYARTSWDDKKNFLHADLAIKNTSLFPIGTPLLVGVTRISDAAVKVRNADGVTPDGIPYYDLTTLVGGAELSPDATSDVRAISFHNPSGQRFTYELVLLGKVNRPPEFTSAPTVEAIAGKAYVYDTAAEDPDGDDVNFDLLVAPDGMSIDGDTGKIDWSPTLADVGNHGVRVLVQDGKGGSSEQRYTVTAIAPSANRPPVFVTPPVVEAHYYAPYVYDADAVDPDLDSVVYSLVSGPAGMTIDPDTGRLTWTPTTGVVAGRTIDFESIPGLAPAGFAAGSVILANARLSDQLKLSHGVSFTSTGGYVAYVNLGVGHATSGARGIGGSSATNFVTYNNPVRITFTMPGDPNIRAVTNTASISADRAGGGGSFTLQAFDINNVLIASDTAIDSPGGKTLTVNKEGIHSLLITQTANNIALDDLKYGPLRSVPEAPVTIAATDPQGAAAQQSFTIRVALQPGNNPPVIVTTPPTQISLDLGTFPPVPVNLANWTKIQYEANAQPDANWVIDAVNNTVTQTVNADPSIFLGDFDFADAKIEGTWRMTPDPFFADDDFVGFVFGYQDPQHFYLFDWKQATQDAALVGMTLKVVDSATPLTSHFWATDGSPNRITSIFHNSIPWQFNVDYRFTLEFHPGTFTISVHQGVTQLASFTLNDSTYTGGKFGFYNYSQGPVRYSGFRTTAVPLPTYTYDVDAIDPDEDALKYSLITAPQGMQIDADTGQITWTVGTNQAGSHPVHVLVSDQRGGIDEQTYTVVVSTSNLPPKITSTPKTTIGLDSATSGGYQYDVDATDPNTDPITFSLVQFPTGATIDPATGVVTWIPTGLGAFPFTVQASDGRGGIHQQAFTLQVTPTGAENNEPIFTSTPPTSAVANEPYSYGANATDADGDTVRYSLAVKPAGMAIDPGTGSILFTPNIGHLGEHQVIVRADDGKGGVALQPFTLTVSPINTVPVISSKPILSTAAAALYHYQVLAQDAEHDPIDFQLDAGPAGMAIDPVTGALSWTPSAAQAGSHQVTISVGDGKATGRGTQQFTLAVLASKPNTPPVIHSSPRLAVRIGGPYVYAVHATDVDADKLTYTMPIAPSGMTIDPNTGVVQWLPTSAHVGQSNAVQIVVSDGRGGSATQDFNIAVASQDSNARPVITSQPPLSATPREQYRYDATAVDPDGDPITWGLEKGPQGMSIHQQLGSVIWTPRPDQGGPHEVIIRVSDPRGDTSFTFQTWTITVRGGNTPPTITSAAAVTASVSNVYTYAVKASDADGDTLAFALPTAPTGMTINPSTGAIAWTPTAAQIGPRAVTVQVSDGKGGTATQNFTINVAATAANRPAVITSTPSFVALVGAEYKYQLLANDPDGDIVRFQLRSGPTGMTVDAVTGLVLWAPTADQAGVHAVSLLAADPQGAGMLQNFNLRAAVNNAPSITSAAITTVTAGVTYQYGVKASDPDNDALKYSLSKAPAGMTIDTLGRIRWTTKASDIAAHEVEVVVTDPFGATAKQSFTLNVTADTQAPKVNVQSNYNPAELNDLVTFLVQASDNVAVTNMTLTVGGVAQALDANGMANVKMTTAGPVNAVATASDAAGNTGTDTLEVFVIDTSDVNAPVVNITAPVNGANVTAPTNIIGTVTDDNLLSYVVEISPADLDSFTQIASGTTPVTNNKLGELDPSLLANGPYTLRLTATDAGGNISSIESTVNVTGELKLGNFKLSFTDLTIPVDGIPIVVSRTYDTLNAKRSGNLGFGWALDFRDSDVRSTVPLTGLEDDLLLYNGFADGDRVYITLPGGEVESFTFRAQLKLRIHNAFLYQPSFVPDPGVTSQLAVDEFVLTDGGNGRWVSLGQPYNLASGQFGNYTLTTINGTKFRIDPIGGDVIDITDRRGNKLTFSNNGVVSSAGPSVTFGRDARGRITSVTDPAGKVIRYAYDANGDLVSVTDRVGNVTGFQYRTDHPHHLERVIDPLGRTGVRTEYDDTGRVVRMFDAAGKAIELGYDAGTSSHTIVDANGHPTTYVYDTRGNVTREIDAAGKVTELTYNANDHMTSRKDPLGRVTTFTNDAFGNVLSETDHLGNVTRATYNSLNLPLTITDPVGNTTTNAFDANGNLTSTTDANGVSFKLSYVFATSNPSSITDAFGAQTLLQYDGAGRVMQQIDPTGAKTAFTYDANGNRLTESVVRTQPDGSKRTLVTSYTYDANDRRTSMTDPEGGVIRTEYDALGNVTATIDPLGRRTEFKYDARSALIETLFADGTSVKRAYDDGRNLIRLTDQLGRETHFVYDALDRLIETIYPDTTPATLVDNPRTKTEYDAAGQVVAEIDERGNRTEYAYDAAGNRVLTRDALGGETKFTYDAASKLMTATDPLGHATRYTYTGIRRSGTTFADGTGDKIAHDARGRVVSRTDANGRVTTYGYDALDQLISVTNALGHMTSYGYDETGNLIRQTDANNRITKYEYDGVGRQTATVLPMGERATNQYDIAGNVVRMIDFKGVNVTFDYDVMNRLVARHYPDGSGVAFTYTADGMRKSETDSRGTTNYEYDARNQLVRRVEPDGRAIQHTYDAAGNRTATITPAQTINYTFDPLNRLKTVNQSSVGTTTYTYDAAGRLTRTDLPNGTAETRSYNALDRLTLLQNVAPDGTTILSSYAYTLDAVGNRLSVLENTGRKVDYSYDAVYRLIEEKITDAANGNRTYGYTYDPVGNRLTRNSSADGTTTYAYDANDRLLSEITAGVLTTYTYDANGNTLSKFTSAADNATYQYTFDNRLEKATIVTSTGANVVEYRYNADGLRVARIENGAETRHLNDTTFQFAQVVEEYSPAGAALALYIHGHDIIAQIRGGVVSIYHNDGLGSTRLLTNLTAVVTDSYIYDAYGNVIARTGTTANMFQFAGQARDAITGLDYLRARYMSPSIGRFTTRDPFPGSTGNPASLHKYMYADDNPVNRTDPSGLFTLGEVAAVLRQLAGAEAAVAVQFGKTVQKVVDFISAFVELLWIAVIAVEVIHRVGDRDIFEIEYKKPKAMDGILRKFGARGFKADGDYWLGLAFDLDPTSTKKSKKPGEQLKTAFNFNLSRPQISGQGGVNLEIVKAPFLKVDLQARIGASDKGPHGTFGFRLTLEASTPNLSPEKKGERSWGPSFKVQWKIVDIGLGGAD